MLVGSGGAVPATSVLAVHAARHQRVPRRPPSSSCTLDCNFGRNEIFPQSVPTCSTCVRPKSPVHPPPSLAPYLLAPPSAERAPRPHVHRQTVRFGYSQSLWATRSVLRAPASPQTPHLWTERIHERISQRVPTCSTRVRQNRPYPPPIPSLSSPRNATVRIDCL